MSTFAQVVRHQRRRSARRPYNRSPKMEGCPQKLGICLRVGTTKPKKPNSAVRKIAKVRLASGLDVRAVIPGSGFEIAEHNTVALRAGRARDIPGVHYRLVRGMADLGPPTGFDRRNRRSKFGQPNWVYLLRNEANEIETVVAHLRTRRQTYQREFDLPVTWGRSMAIPMPPGLRLWSDEEDEPVRD